MIIVTIVVMLDKRRKVAAVRAIARRGASELRRRRSIARRTALVRRAGRVPDNVSFGRPEAWPARALVIGGTPALLALDRQKAGTHAG